MEEICHLREKVFELEEQIKKINSNNNETK